MTEEELLEHAWRLGREHPAGAVTVLVEKWIGNADPHGGSEDKTGVGMVRGYGANLDFLKLVEEAETTDPGPLYGLAAELPAEPGVYLVLARPVYEDAERDGEGRITCPEVYALEVIEVDGQRAIVQLDASNTVEAPS